MRLTHWCPIDLAAAVDVYSDWVDACDSVAKEANDEVGGRDLPVARQQDARRRSGNVEGDADEDDLIDDDLDNGYGGDGIVADDEY